MRRRTLLLLPVVAALVSCGGGSGDELPLRPGPVAQPIKEPPPLPGQDFFSWAESRFPSLFPLTMQGTLVAGDMLYRKYPASGVALALYHGGVYAQGGLTGNRLVHLGWQSSFPPLSPVWYVPVHDRSYSTRSGSVVIRDASQWAAAWAELWRNYPGGQAPFAMPEVDFSKEMLVGFQGVNSRGCGSQVQRVEVAGDGVRVFYTEGPTAWCTEAAAQSGVTDGRRPANLVKIPAVAGSVEFVQVPEVAWTPMYGPTGSFRTDATARTLVVRDEPSWRDAWASLFMNGSPSPPLPAVDFSTRMVVGVYLGARPNGCYGMSVVKVTETDSAVTVFYRETIPTGTGFTCTAAFVFPSALLTIPATAKPVVFVGA